MNPTRHVMIAMTLTLVLLIVAGDQWSPSVARFKPVAPAARRA